MTHTLYVNVKNHTHHFQYFNNCNHCHAQIQSDYRGRRWEFIESGTRDLRMPKDIGRCWDLRSPKVQKVSRQNSFQPVFPSPPRMRNPSQIRCQTAKRIIFLFFDKLNRIRFRIHVQLDQVLADHDWHFREGGAAAVDTRSGLRKSTPPSRGGLSNLSASPIADIIITIDNCVLDE